MSPRAQFSSFVISCAIINVVWWGKNDPPSSASSQSAWNSRNKTRSYDGGGNKKNKLQPKLIRWSRRVDCLCVCLPPPRTTILVFAAERRHFTEQFYDALLLLLPSATRPQQKSLVARSRGLASSPYFTTGSPERMHPLQIPLSPDYTDIRQQLFFLHGHQTTSPQNRTPYSAKRCC